MRITERDIGSIMGVLVPFAALGYLFSGWAGAIGMASIVAGTVVAMLWPAYIYWIFHGTLMVLKKR